MGERPPPRLVVQSPPGRPRLRWRLRHARQDVQGPDRRVAGAGRPSTSSTWRSGGIPTPSTSNRPPSSRSPATASRCPGDTPEGWPCASPACCATGRTRRPPTRTPSTPYGCSWARPPRSVRSGRHRALSPFPRAKPASARKISRADAGFARGNRPGRQAAGRRVTGGTDLMPSSTGGRPKSAPETSQLRIPAISSGWNSIDRVAAMEICGVEARGYRRWPSRAVRPSPGRTAAGGGCAPERIGRGSPSTGRLVTSAVGRRPGDRGGPGPCGRPAGTFAAVLAGRVTGSDGRGGVSETRHLDAGPPAGRCGVSGGRDHRYGVPAGGDLRRSTPRGGSRRLPWRGAGPSGSIGGSGSGRRRTRWRSSVIRRSPGRGLLLRLAPPCHPAAGRG